VARSSISGRATPLEGSNMSTVRNLHLGVLSLGLRQTFASRVSDIRAMIAQQDRIFVASERLVLSFLGAVTWRIPRFTPLKIFVARSRNANPFGGKTNVAKMTGVQVGQQYVKVHSTRTPPPVWEVNSIHPGIIGITHAGLMNLADPVDKKTVSFSALLDKTHYRLVKNAGAAA
jgi:hypothetical protein